MVLKRDSSSSKEKASIGQCPYVALASFECCTYCNIACEGEHLKLDRELSLLRPPGRTDGGSITSLRVTRYSAFDNAENMTDTAANKR